MAQGKEANQPQSARDFLRIIRENEPEIKWVDGKPTTLTEANVRKFVQGELTFAQLEGVSMEQAYAIAELSYRMFQQGKYDEALKIVDGLIILNPYDNYFHALKGSILARQGNMDEALRELNIACEMDPKDPQTFVNRADIYLTQGRFEEALLDLKEAISLDPEGHNPAVLRARAMAGATLGLIQEALEQRQKEESKGGKK